MQRNKTIYQVLTLTACSVAFVSCAKDRTQADFLRQQVQQELARVAPATGVFSGSVTYPDGTNLGTLSINVEADAVNMESPTNGATTQRATLKATAVLNATNSAQIQLSQGYFDSGSGVLNFSQSINQRNGDQATLDFKGKVSGNTLTGTVDAGYLQEQGSFTLSKVAAGSSINVMKMKNGTNYGGPKVLEEFVAPIQSAKFGAEYAYLIFMNYDLTPEQIFLDNFLGVQLVDVSFETEVAKNPDPKTHVGPFFQFAQYNQEKGTLHALSGATSTSLGSAGTGTSSSASGTSGNGNPSEGYKVVLDCQSIALAGNQQGWKCDYSSNFGKIYQGLVFAPYVAPAAVNEDSSESEAATIGEAQ